MMTYIIISYLVMLGVMIGNNSSYKDLTANEYGIFALSPFTLPIIVGIMISDL